MINLARPNKLMAISNANLIFLPTPRNIRTFWNFGFLLAATLRLQLITGIFLAITIQEIQNFPLQPLV